MSKAMKTNTPTTEEPAPKKGDRSPENAVTSFSVSRKLLAEAQALARSEKRPLSNLIAKILEEEIARRKQSEK